jgi:DNA-binding NarL/FixJ family response regulator
VTIRVLLADDQELIRAGFRAIIETTDDIQVVAEASTGRAAVDLAGQADGVLMDIRMPDLDGLAATREICARHDSVRVLVLTTCELDEYVFQALRAGPAGSSARTWRRTRCWPASGWWPAATSCSPPGRPRP